MRTVEYPGDLKINHSIPPGGKHLRPESLVFSPPLKVEIGERRFGEEDHPIIDKDLILAGATLANPTDKPVQVDFWLGTFHLEMKTDSLVSRRPPDPNMPPLPPPVPPPPFRVTVPAKTTVKFTDWVRLEEFVYEGSPVVQVEWTLRYAGDPKPSGTFSIKLPHRKPAKP